MKAGELVADVAKHLSDEGHTRWSKADLLDWMTMGIQTFIIKKPTISQVTKTISLSGGVINLPGDGYKLLGVNHVDDIAVTYVDIDKLNQLFPAWRRDVGTPSNWTKVDDEDKQFVLHPKPDAEVQVEFVYSANLKVEDEKSPFPISDIYKAIIFDYMVYRAYDQDSEDTINAQLAQNHLMLYATGIGDTETAERIRKQWLATKEISR